MTDEKLATPNTVIIFTMGFVKRSARDFFAALKDAGVRRVIDARLNNQSQLAGFTKLPDFEYFLSTIASIEYVHVTVLAPTKDLLDAYRKKAITWSEYEARFLKLMADRHIETIVRPQQLDKACLLCSEAKPDQCHRRLVAEYLKSKWGNVEIRDL